MAAFGLGTMAPLALSELVDDPLFRLAFIVDPLTPFGATGEVWFHEVNENFLIDSILLEYYCVDCRRTNLSIDEDGVPQALYPTMIANVYTNTTVCCQGVRGNMDGDAGQLIDIGDLTFLVQFMFQDGPPPCFEEADMDAGGSLNIGDLVYLVNYMFNGGPPPPPCP